MTVGVVTFGNPANTKSPKIIERSRSSKDELTLFPIVIVTVAFHSGFFERRRRHSDIVAAPEMSALKKKTHCEITHYLKKVHTLLGR